MLIFWQECKHILRSRFLWVVVILGSIFAVYNNTLVAANLGSDISFSYEFTDSMVSPIRKRRGGISRYPSGAALPSTGFKK